MIFVEIDQLLMKWQGQEVLAKITVGAGIGKLYSPIAHHNS